MRFVKEHLEVITCYIPSAHEITSTIESFDELKLCKDHFPPNTCFNVFWFNQKSWAAPICRYISEYFDTLKELSSAKEGSMAVVRLCALDKQRESSLPKKVVTSGSGFYMLPNLVITNCHVNEKIGTNPCFAFSNAWNIGYFDDALKQVEQLPEKKRLCFSGQLLKLTPYETKFKQTKIWTGIDAITGEIGDFSFFDFSAVLFTGKPNNVIFIPSSTVLQPGDEIITLSYPGDEENTSPLKDYANYASWAPSELVMKSNIFNGYGTLCASFGKILHPFRNINDEWEKDEEFRIGQDSPTCGMMESLPCKTIRYPIDNLMNNTNSGNNILIKLMNNWIGDCILFNNENVTIDSIHFMGTNRLVNLECSADQNQVKIPLVRFSNLNLDLVMFGVSQLEIFNCTIVDFVVNDIRRSLILDNIQVGTENLKQLLEKDSNIDLKKVIFNIFIELGSIDTSSKEVIVRNSHIIGCNLYVGSTLSNGSLLVENSTFEYSLLDLTNGLGYTPKSVPRPSFYIASSKFYRSSIQAREALSVTIQNCELIQNIPNKLAIVLSLIPNSIYAAFSVTSSAICNVLVSASVFSNCQSVGAMYLEGTGINAEVEWSHFKDNSNVKGGAAINLQTIYNLFAHNTIFENNKQVLDSSESLSNIKADERGGGAILQYQSLLTTESCIFINNEGITGGAVLNFQAHKYKSSVDKNKATKYGGAIFTLKTVLNLGFQTFSINNNYAGISGGGAYTVGTKQENGVPLIDRCKDNYNGNGKLSNHDAFPEIISLRIPVKQFLSMSNDSNSNAKMLETSFGEKLVLNLDLFDNTYGNDNIPVNSFTEMELSVETKPSKDMTFEIHQPTTNEIDGILYSRSTNEKLRGNGTLIFTIKSSLFKTGTFSSQIEIAVTPMECKPWFSLQADMKKIVNGGFAYSCEFNSYLIIPFVVSSVLIVGCIVFTIIGIVCFKFYGMKSKIKVLHKKEQAEEELTQKLLDLQSLYTSELESKYSIKNWLIKIEDIKVIKKIGEGGMGVVYLAL
ncbi:predicted protein [Naegleria gruberi]|uniref:Predicted protein n=1 Tax=Naegleria gruberi TaxID=5762 RepID=D2VE07_NAEGR|nr:uncharacterized protein NAEGRDRAFT_48784 [Naegleria gruberi]EFC44993.1 predicted protein [Naegleria gruberi]|eukprot:XP_002677737.1 predicted protein [Naegleria gruberi strain NEG-M]